MGSERHARHRDRGPARRAGDRHRRGSDDRAQRRVRTRRRRRWRLHDVPDRGAPAARAREGPRRRPRVHRGKLARRARVDAPRAAPSADVCRRRVAVGSVLAGHGRGHRAARSSSRRWASSRSRSTSTRAATSPRTGTAPPTPPRSATPGQMGWQRGRLAVLHAGPNTVCYRFESGATHDEFAWKARTWRFLRYLFPN